MSIRCRCKGLQMLRLTTAFRTKLCHAARIDDSRKCPKVCCGSKYEKLAASKSCPHFHQAQTFVHAAGADSCQKATSFQDATASPAFMGLC
jgi:hypothetical protein